MKLVEVFRVVLENMPCSLNDIYHKRTWLTFKDCVTLRSVCSELRNTVTKYQMFNINYLDHQVYRHIKAYNGYVLHNTSSFLVVERYLELFGIGDGSALNYVQTSDLAILYMKYGANPLDSKNKEFLRYAFHKSKFFDVVDYLLSNYHINVHEFKIPIYDSDETIAQVSTYNLQLIPVLLKHGLDYNYRCTSCGKNLLHKASEYPNIVAELLKYPINIDENENYWKSHDLVQAEIQRRKKQGKMI